ncbi:MAG: hypothetical protein LBC81_01595 [Tannerellaceae bacterium]|jgi:hypothetical protein|nr:hypothetical protein [Tannerellaceae bacterium]
MKGKQIFLMIIMGMIVVTTISATVLCIIMYKEKPLMSLFAGCCGVLLDINFVATWYLIKRNFKD